MHGISNDNRTENNGLKASCYKAWLKGTFPLDLFTTRV